MFCRGATWGVYRMRDTIALLNITEQVIENLVLVNHGLYRIVCVEDTVYLANLHSLRDTINSEF